MPDHPPGFEAAVKAAAAACPQTYEGTVRKILLAAWPHLPPAPEPDRREHDCTSARTDLGPRPRVRAPELPPPRSWPTGFSKDAAP